MSSRTEQAILALVAALTVQAGIGSPAIPVPTRNNTLPAKFAAFNAVAVFFNVLDGDGKVEDTSLGNPDEAADSYRIFHRAQIEWAVQAVSDTDREAAFDAGLVAINAALAADRSLGAMVDWCEIDETIRSNLVTDALPNTKAIVVYVRLEFLSSMPF